MSLKPQKDYESVPIVVMKQAVAREMYRDRWSYEDGAPEGEAVLSNPMPAAVAMPQQMPLIFAVQSNGNGAH